MHRIYTSHSVYDKNKRMRTSSKKRIAGADALALIKSVLTALSESPTYLERSSGPLTLRKDALASLAVALATKVCERTHHRCHHYHHRRRHYHHRCLKLRMRLSSLNLTLPHPGGPYKSTPWDNPNPIASNFSGSLMGCVIAK